MEYKDLERVNSEIKTVDIKGKDYAEVPKRVTAFRKLFPEGTIETEIISCNNGVCVFKAIAKDGDKVLGTGHAYEKEGSTFINKTSYIENCVPLNSQILTREGWKYYYQLHEGEDVLSYNMEAGKMEFCSLIRVNAYTDRPLLEMISSRFRVRCTSLHKWLARTQYKGISKVATEELTNSWKIVQAVEQDIEPSEIGKKLGWLMCDCNIVTAGGMASSGYISQSKYIEEVSILFGSGKLTKKYNENWKDNYEWFVPATQVRSILGHFGMANYHDLPYAMAKADISDVKGCYESMMLADGEAKGFSSTYRELVDAIQIMCARLGIATTFITERTMEKSTKPIYTIGIKKTDGAWFSELTVRNIPPQDVWCPTTENGTWVMRQDGFVTLTSNCETSAVGRALGFVGIGIETSIASYEEVQNAKNNQNKSKPVQQNAINRDEAINRIKELSKEKDISIEDVCSIARVKKLEDLEDARLPYCIKYLEEL